MRRKPPEWITRPNVGMHFLAVHQRDAFYRLFGTLLEAAYNDGRLSVLQEAFEAAQERPGEERK